MTIPRIRIAFCTNQWPDVRPGGIGTYVCEMSAALAAGDCDVHVFTFTAGGRPLQAPPGVHFHAIPCLAEQVASGRLHPRLARTIVRREPTRRLAEARLLCESLLAEHYRQPFDLAEFADYEGHALPLIAGPRPDLPVVVHLHQGSAISRRHNHLPTSPDDAVCDAAEFASILAADALCAPSCAVTNETRSFDLDLPDPTVIPHASIGPGDEAWRPPPPRGPILFLGRLQTIKGADLLAEALPSFLSDCPDATARFVGADTRTAPDGRSMRAWIESRLPRELRSRVTFAGAVPRAAIWTELHAARFCVLPSRFESFGYTAIESITAGRTAVIPRGSALHETLGDTGVPFEPGSSRNLAAALQALWRDDARLDQLSWAAFERSRTQFSPRTIARRRIEFYLRVKNTGPRRENSSARLFEPAPRHNTALQQLLDGNLPRENTPSCSPGDRLKTALAAVDCGRPQSFMLYGAGWHTDRLLAERDAWESNGHTLLGLIDDNDSALPKHIHGLPVCRRDALFTSPRHAATNPIIVISSDSVEQQIESRCADLRAAGFRVLGLYSSPLNPIPSPAIPRETRVRRIPPGMPRVSTADAPGKPLAIHSD